MKKFFSFIIIFLMLFLITSCKEEVLTIKIYNCVDYIDEEVLDQFVEWYKDRHNGEEIEVVYDTYETNESMYNTLRSGKTSYDLCCPSDYMIQKMIRENMVEEFDGSKLDIYRQNCSPYILNLFEEQGWTNFAACYMWGTLGIIYNPSILGELMDTKNDDGEYEYDVESWEDFNNPKFKGVISLKDSVRDSYCVAQILANKDMLMENIEITDDEIIYSDNYNQLIQETINRVSNEDIEKAEKELRRMKPNLFGLEVDSAKGDIVTGKIAMNLAWSGDAVYSIELAAEEDIELRYTVPIEGGNVWFDGWVMPKGANKELALEFINFLSQPEIAVLNMNEIGYTSPIAGDAIFELIKEWYGEDSLDEGEDINDYEFEEFDLSYFFGDTLSEEYQEEVKKVKIESSNVGSGFTAQYPDEDTLIRCGVMEDFKDQNEAVLQMWINFRANKASTTLIIALILFVLLCVVVFLFSKKSYIERVLRAKKAVKQNK